jgi:hypothetical protein
MFGIGTPQVLELGHRPLAAMFFPFGIYTHIMLRIITDIADPLLDFLKDDPVRPDIPREFRVTEHRFVAALVDEQPRAMVCVSLKQDVPATVGDLSGDCAEPTTAVFYTIWSYVSGAASELLFDTVAEIQQKFPTVTRFVTLSPKTEMAHKFHMRNGARVFRENADTINYEYVIGA